MDNFITDGCLHDKSRRRDFWKIVNVPEKFMQFKNTLYVPNSISIKKNLINFIFRLKNAAMRWLIQIHDEFEMGL